MSEETDASVPKSETAESEKLQTPPGKGRGKKLWLMIAAIVIAVLLVSTAVIFMFVLTGLKATMTPASIDMDAGKTIQLSVTAKWGGKTIGNTSDIKYMWSVEPSTLGSLLYRAKQTIPFKADIVAGTGTMKCEVTYKGETVTVTAPLNIKAPYLASISIVPQSKTLPPGTNYTFTATAVSSVQLPISNVDFTWSVTGMPSGSYTLNATTGSKVRLTAGPTYGNLTLTATGTYQGVTKEGNASIAIAELPPRHVDYYWYDMFNVPFGSWWDKRAEMAESGNSGEVPITHEYPYIYKYYSGSKDNLWIYTNMRMNITGRNVSELNMNERPEFLPFLSTTERGGTAVIDWYLQYLTPEEMAQFPESTAGNYDGWVVSLNGTVTLDKQASKAVLNVTDADWPTFADWWTANSGKVMNEYGAWLSYEGNKRLDIYNAYEYPLVPMTFKLDATKVGENVVLKYSMISWGMEVLMTRWMHDSFMATEWYFEDMKFKATIGPEFATLDVTTAVVYASYAMSEGTVHLDKPTWGWEGLYQDYVHSSLAHPKSDYDKYAAKDYYNNAPGSNLWGTMMTYDYAPQAWNLTANETLTFSWPARDDCPFIVHLKPGKFAMVNDSMTVTYMEPDNTDELVPNATVTVNNGTVSLDTQNRKISFVGPIDMWDWSHNETTKPALKEEWDRLGVLPYGTPYIEFEPVHNISLHPDVISVEYPSSIPAGDMADLKVTVLDQFGNVYYPTPDQTNFTYTVHFSSNDTLANLPVDYTFTDADNSTHTFSGVTLNTAGVRSITVTNVSGPAVTGSKIVTVTPKRTAASFQVDVYYLPSVGVPEDVTVTSYDQYGDVFLNYTGTIDFTTNRTGEVILPGSYDFVLGDQGVHTFPAALNFAALGAYNITVNDSSNAAITGSETDIWVEASPEVIDHFVVSGVEPSMLTFQTSSVTVAAYDQYDKLFKRYTGEVNFSSNASTAAVLPANYTFTLSDQGVKEFVDAVHFTAGGVFDVVVIDTATPSATGTQTDILIQVRPKSETFRMYDMFQEPWGEWWPWRYPTYITDLILNNESGKYTMVYNPDMLGYHGIIYAPYRWNVTASNMTDLNVHKPVLMPILGTPKVPGAQVELDINFQYLDWSWWNSYWVPTWSSDPNWAGQTPMNIQIGDGWYTGVVIEAKMNRQAAEEWIGLPQSASVSSWWTANYASYLASYTNWLHDQGNNVYDIYCGWQALYTDQAIMMKLVDNGDGTVTLVVGDLSSGYEILMLRWLTASNVNKHEAYFEDFTMSAQFYSGWTDLTFDAVAQYSLQAVKATESATDEGAWAWQPLLVDYLPSVGTHPSQFDPWASVYFLSTNSIDPSLGYDVAYDSGLTYFNLTDYQKFVIELPMGSDILCYKGKYVTDNSIIDLYYYDFPTPSNPGSIADYTNNEYNGSMSLGYYASGGVDIDALYNSGSNTITMVGPLNFDNAHHPNGALFHGAPWIEFNVSVGGSSTSIPVPSGGVGESTRVAAGPTMTAEMTSLIAIMSGVLVCVAAIGASARRKT